MLVSRGRNPSAAEVITQLVQNPELRGRVLTTLGLLMLIRLGIYIPMPGIDRVAFQSFIEQGGQLIGFLDIFTGGGISTLGVFALGILPFINASIILQLLTASLPQLEDLQKNEGEAGRRKLAQITRYVALGWGLIQSIIFAMILRPYAIEGLSEVVFVAQTALALVTGSMVVMWLSEVITERGIGQGASLVIFLNIVATLPKALGSTIEKAQTGDRNGRFRHRDPRVGVSNHHRGNHFCAGGSATVTDHERQAPGRGRRRSSQSSELSAPQVERRRRDADHLRVSADFLASHPGQCQ